MQDTETHRSGRRRYNWNTAALTDGTAYEFLVKAYRSVGGGDYYSIGVQAGAVADSSGPPAIDYLFAEQPA